MNNFSKIFQALLISVSICGCNFNGGQSFIINDVSFDTEVLDPKEGRCIEIQAHYTAKGFTGKDLIECVAFGDANGNALIDIDNQWNVLLQEGGQVGVQTTFPVKLKEENGITILRFPIKELNIEGTNPVELSFALLFATNEQGEVTEDTLIYQTEGYLFTVKP